MKREINSELRNTIDTQVMSEPLCVKLESNIEPEKKSVTLHLRDLDVFEMEFQLREKTVYILDVIGDGITVELCHIAIKKYVSHELSEYDLIYSDRMKGFGFKGDAHVCSRF